MALEAVGSRPTTRPFSFFAQNFPPVKPIPAVSTVCKKRFTLNKSPTICRFTPAGHIDGHTREGLKRLRETLKLISFHNPGVHFKADRKEDCVWIRAMKSEHGEQRTIASTKAALSILTDAATMTPEAFRERLEEFLKKRGFTLSKANE